MERAKERVVNSVCCNCRFSGDLSLPQNAPFGAICSAECGVNLIFDNCIDW